MEKSTNQPADLYGAEVQVNAPGKEMESNTESDFSDDELFTTSPIDLDVSEMELAQLTSAEYVDPLTRPPFSWSLE
jgi:hypothetical protein